MQTFGNNAEKLTLRGVWVTLLMVLTMGLLTTAASAQITTTQTNFLTPFPSAVTSLSPYGSGALSGGDPAGLSWGINSKGIVVASATYGNFLMQINAATGALASPIPTASTQPNAVSNPSGVAIDSNNYLYVSGMYTNHIARIPMNSDGTYTISTDPTTATLPTCEGGTSDTAPCLITPLSVESIGYYGVASMTVDAAGDLFIVTDGSGSDAQYSIYECSTSCLYGSSPTAPVALYSETLGTSSDQNYIGSIAVDASGNVFFTDSLITNDGNNTSTNSWLKEIPYTTGSGYGSAETLESFTTPTPGQYDDEIDAVSVDASGDVYFANQLTGIFELINSSGTFDTANPVFITPQGAKLLLAGSQGSLYLVANTSGADTFGQITVNPAITFAGTTYIGGTPATAAVTVADSSENCSNALLSFTATEGGSPTTDFSGATAGACGATDYGTGSAFPVTISFSPSIVGPVTGLFTTTDTTSTVSGSISVAGTGAPLPTPQSITWTTLPGTVLVGQGPWTITAAGGGSGQPVIVSVDKSTSPSGIATVTQNQNGTYTLVITGAGTIVVDANQAGGTTGGVTYSPAPQLQQTIIATAVTTPSGGPPLVVTQTNFLTPFPSAVTSLSPYGSGALSGGDPAGLSWGINSKGIVVASATYGNFLMQINAATGALASPIPTASTQPNAVSNPSGVAIDSNNYLYVSGMYTNHIARIPMNSDGTYTISTDPTTATLPTCEGGTSDTAPCLITPLSVESIGYYGVASMTVDAAGDLFIVTDGSGSDAQYSIYECSTSCLYGSSPTAPVALYSETLGTSSDQNYIGSIAVDASGNVFFTDSLITNDGNNTSTNSWLKEIPYTTGSGYGSAETLESFTTPTPGQYDDEIDAVSVDASGDVYFANQLTGIFELINSSGTFDTANPVFITPQGAKLLLAGSQGSLYLVANTSGADTFGQITVGSVAVTPQTTPGNPVSVSDVEVTDNYVACTSLTTLAFNFTDSEFTGAVPSGSICSPTDYGTGSSLPATISFDPGTGATGTITDTLTVGDSINGGSGTATVTGESLTTQAITGFSGITSPAAFGGGPYTLSATGGSSGNAVTFTLDPSTTGYTSSTTSSVATLSGTNNDTLTLAGTGTIVIDMNQAGGVNNGTTYAAAPQVQETITVNAGSQIIRFTNPSSGTTALVYGVSPITLAATGGDSGNAVTFKLDPSTQGYASATSSLVATLSGTNNDVLTILGVTTGSGAIVVDANQAASSDYTAAATAQVVFVVSAGSQNINLTASASTQVYPNTISLTATGGASGQAVQLSITSGSSVATLSGTTLTPTGTAFGPVTVTATQAGSSDYSAAAAKSVTVTFTPIGTIATPTISPASDSTVYVGVNNILTITDATSNATIYYTTDGTTPTIASQVYTGAITEPTGSYTINAIAWEAGYQASTPASSSFTVSSVAPNFTATASPGAVDLSPGGSAILDITITPNASFLGTVTFSCSGAPAGVTCSFSPASVTANGVSTVTTVLTLTDAASSSSAIHHGPNPFIPGGATFALALCFLGFKRRRGLVLGLVLLAGIFGFTQLTGCANNAGISSTGSTTSSMTVTATSSFNGTTITQTVPVSITIRN